MKTNVTTRTIEDILEDMLTELKIIRREVQKRDKPALPDLGIIDNTQLMQLLNISKRTAAALRSSGELRYTVKGNRTFYKVADVKEMMEKNFPRK